MRHLRTSIRTLILSVIAVLLASCATGPTFSEIRSTLPAVEVGKARVYFYRTGVVGGAYQPDVLLNGEAVGTATPRGVFFKDVAPGSYTATTTITSEKIAFEVRPGEKKYVRLSYRFGFNIYPELVEEAAGKAEIQDLGYVKSR